MKWLKWLAVLVAILAAVAAALYLYRDTVARNLANSMLGDSGLVVVSVSMRTVSTSQLEFSRLVVESRSGDRYDMRGLSVLLAPGTVRPERVSAETLDVSYGAADDEPSMLSTTLATAFELASIRPRLDVHIGRVSLPDLPLLLDLSLQMHDAGQDLALTMDTTRITAMIASADDGTHRLTTTVSGAGDQAAFTGEFTFTAEDERFTATGFATANTLSLMPLMQLFDLVPEGITGLDAGFQGTVAIRLDAEQPGDVAFDAELVIGGNWAVSQQASSGELTRLRGRPIERLRVGFEYPSLDWTARAESISASVDAAGFENQPVTVRSFDCRAGIHCSMIALVNVTMLERDGYGIDSAALSLPLELNLGDDMLVKLLPQTTATFTGIRNDDLSLASASVTGFSGADIVVDDDGWRTQIDRLQLAVSGMQVGDGLSVSARPTFSDLSIGSSGDVLQARATLRAGSGDGLSARIDVKNNAAAGTGTLTLRDATLAFDRARIADFLPGRKFDWEILGGTWLGDLTVNWRADGNYSGRLSQQFDGVSGRYDDYALVGLNTRVDIALDSAAGHSIAPSSLTVRKLDVGLPLDDITADYVVDLGAQTLAVENFGLRLFGGRLSADPFELAAAAERNRVPLRVESVQLQLMADVLDFGNIGITGSISGNVPMVMTGTDISVDRGRLVSDPPGGVIRYRSDDPLDNVASESGIRFVTRALRNFEYDALSSDVSYSEDGNLNLQIRLTGINPDVDPLQPVILNLGIDNNIPKMLRSLRAVRSIEDILERRTAN